LYNIIKHEHILIWLITIASSLLPVGILIEQLVEFPKFEDTCGMVGSFTQCYIRLMCYHGSTNFIKHGL
jgi:hypothetical protein